MSHRRRRSRDVGSRSRGFTLAEVMVALALLLVVLGVALATVAREPLLRVRMDAHRRTLDGLEDWVEAVRAGAPLVATDSRGALEIVGEATPLVPAGLCRLTVTGTDASVEPPVTARLETDVWRPGSDCK